MTLNLFNVTYFAVVVTLNVLNRPKRFRAITAVTTCLFKEEWKHRQHSLNHEDNQMNIFSLLSQPLINRRKVICVDNIIIIIQTHTHTGVMNEKPDLSCSTAGIHTHRHTQREEKSQVRLFNILFVFLDSNGV